MSNPHIKWLRQAEKEIVSAGHFGWGNTCSDAADCIAELEQQIAEANERTDDLISAQVDVQAKLAAAIQELRNIANAKPSTWTDFEPKDREEQFRPWAQNRARAAVYAATDKEGK